MADTYTSVQRLQPAPGGAVWRLWRGEVGRARRRMVAMVIFARIILFVCLLVAVSACQTIPVEQSAQKSILSNIEFHVGWPNLSPDGRYLVFDFYTRNPSRAKRRRSPMVLVLYDLQNKTVEYLQPEDEQLYFWHSPSFDSTGQYLTFISMCPFLTCSDEERGSQIAVFDLKNRQFRRITNGRNKHVMWGYSFTTKRSWKSPKVVSGTGMIRGAPTFSSDNKYIFYAANSGAKGSAVFSEQSLFEYQLRRVDLESFNCLPDCIEESAIQEDQGAVLFAGDGRIARAGKGTLVFTGSNPLGSKIEEYSVKKLSAFFYDLKSKEIAVAFDRGTLGDQYKFLPKSQTPHVMSLSASNDGSKIAFINSHQTHLSLWQGGKLQDIFQVKDFGDGNGIIEHSAISGNGNWVVAFTNNSRSGRNQDRLWLIDLKNKTRQEMPLLSLLRKTLPKNFY